MVTRAWDSLFIWEPSNQITSQKTLVTSVIAMTQRAGIGQSQDLGFGKDESQHVVVKPLVMILNPEN